MTLARTPPGRPPRAARGPTTATDPGRSVEPVNGPRQKEMRMSAINVHGLSKRFGDVLAVDNLGFEVEEGTVVGFLGPNGAGKTTTLRMLLGLVAPTTGTATFGDRAYRELEEPTRVVGAVLEASGFHPGRTARNHLRVLATAAGIPARRVDQALAQVGLADAAGR